MFLVATLPSSRHHARPSLPSDTHLEVPHAAHPRLHCTGHEGPGRKVPRPHDGVDEVLLLRDSDEEARGGQAGAVAARAHGQQQALEASGRHISKGSIPSDVGVSAAGEDSFPGEKEREETGRGFGVREGGREGEYMRS